MVPVPVGEDDPFDSPEINPQQRDVALEGLLFRPCVEEDGVPPLATIGRDQA
jgi:hypothetical protein